MRELGSSNINSTGVSVGPNAHADNEEGSDSDSEEESVHIARSNDDNA